MSTRRLLLTVETAGRGRDEELVYNDLYQIWLAFEVLLTMRDRLKFGLWVADQRQNLRAVRVGNRQNWGGGILGVERSCASLRPEYTDTAVRDQAVSLPNKTRGYNIP